MSGRLMAEELESLRAEIDRLAESEEQLQGELGEEKRRIRVRLQREVEDLRRRLEEVELGGGRQELVAADELREWSGQKRDMEVDYFIERVDLLRSAGGWTDRETVLLVRRRLTCEAAEFARNAGWDATVEMTWEEAKELLMNRFGRRIDRLEEVTNLIRLRRRPKQSYRRFADICRTAARYVVRDYSSEEGRRVAADFREELMLGVFLDNMDSHLRCIIKAQGDITTVNQALAILARMGEER